jgi:hypothetical protein
MDCTVTNLRVTFSLPRYLRGRTEKTYDKPQYGEPVSGSKFEPGTFRTRSMNAIHRATTEFCHRREMHGVIRSLVTVKRTRVHRVWQPQSPLIIPTAEACHTHTERLWMLIQTTRHVTQDLLCPKQVATQNDTQGTLSFHEPASKVAVKCVAPLVPIL